MPFVGHCTFGKQPVCLDWDAIGIDLVEAAPDYDQTGSTAFLAARLLLNVPGFVFHEKGPSD